MRLGSYAIRALWAQILLAAEEAHHAIHNAEEIKK
jgi:hypothetical protein